MKSCHGFLPRVLLVLLVAGCSSNSNAVLSSAPSVDFTQLKTLDFVKVADTGGYGMGYDRYFEADNDGCVASRQTMIDKYTEGRLDIDQIDPRARQFIWQGSTKGRLTKKNNDNVEATLNGAVAEIFTQFPIAVRTAEYGAHR